MNSSRLSLLVPWLVLLVAVQLGRPSENRLALTHGGSQSQWATLAGSGGTLAVMGGMRSMVASAFWLRANLAWEHRDAAATTAWLHLTVAADERPFGFWLNGARMLAFDLPEWRLREDSPAAVRQQVVQEQVTVALAFLQRGEEWRGPSPHLTLEMANIRLRALGDREGAARLFRRAAEQPGAPYFAARIHAELLRSLGRNAEALAWLRQILPELPAQDPMARREVVEQRIKELESVLREG